MPTKSVLQTPNARLPSPYEISNLISLDLKVEEFDLSNVPYFEQSSGLLETVDLVEARIFVELVDGAELRDGDKTVVD